MSDDSRIDSILGEWRARRDAGEAVTPDDVIAVHPDLADSLRARFDALAALAAAKSPTLREVAAERYAEFRVLGQGGMGIVYWALDTDLNRQVAFKVVRPDAGQSGAPTPEAPLHLAPPSGGTPASQAFATLKARFLQEAWVTAGLEHPGIVPVYEVGQTPEGVPYYTMRFVKGNRTFAAEIAEAQGKSIDERLALLEPFLKVCDTIRYAHAHDVIHRDLKPDNVALGEFGEVVVLDWGLAKMTGKPDAFAETWQHRLQEYRDAADLRTLASALGTPGYMSPEAALGRTAEVDAKSDVYSLGAILFQILTGRLPYEFRSYGELAMKLMREDPPRPESFDPAIPAEIAEITVNALARDRAHRSASADALAADVRGWLAQRAQDRELEALRQQARAAFDSAAELMGDLRLHQLDRAASACDRVLARREGDDSAAALRREIDALRDRGIDERASAMRRTALRRAGTAALVFLVVAGAVVAKLLDDRATEAEQAREDLRREAGEKGRALARVEEEQAKTKAALGAERNERQAKEAALNRVVGVAFTARAISLLDQDPSLALNLAVEGARRHPDAEAASVVARALAGGWEHRRFPLPDSQFHKSVCLSEDGGRLLTSAVHAFPAPACLFDVEAATPVRSNLPGSLDVFLPDGSGIVAFDEMDRTYHMTEFPGVVLDTRTLERSAQLEAPPDAASRDLRMINGKSAVDSSADGSIVALRSWAQGKTAEFDVPFIDLWDTRSGKHLGAYRDCLWAWTAADGSWGVAAGPAVAQRWKRGGAATIAFEAPRDASGARASWALAIVEQEGRPLLLVASRAAKGGCELALVEPAIGEPLRAIGVAERPVIGAWTSRDHAKVFVVAADGVARLWSADGTARGPAFELRTACDGETYECDAEKLLAAELPWELDDHMRVALEVGGDSAAVAFAGHSKVHVLDPRSGARTFLASGSQGPVTSVSLSRDGSVLAVGGEDGQARTYRLLDRRAVTRIRWSSGRPSSVALSPDGTRVAVVGVGPSAVSIADTATGRIVSSPELPAASYLASFSATDPDVVLFAPSGDASPTGATVDALLVQASTGAVLRRVVRMGSCDAARFDSAGHRVIALVNGAVASWDASTCRAIGRVGGRDEVPYGTSGMLIWGDGVSPDGDLAVLAMEKGLRIREIATGNLVRDLEVDDLPYEVAWSRDGRRLAAFGKNMMLRVWRRSDWALDARIHLSSAFGPGAPQLLALAFAPSGDALVARDIRTGRVVAVDLATNGVRDAAVFRPGAIDGALDFARPGELVVACEGDGAATILDLASMHEVLRVAPERGRGIGGSEAIEPLAVSADGSHFATAAWDGSVTIWPIDPIRAADGCGVRPLTDEERRKYVDTIDMPALNAGK